MNISSVPAIEASGAFSWDDERPTQRYPIGGENWVGMTPTLEDVSLNWRVSKKTTLAEALDDDELRDTIMGADLTEFSHAGTIVVANGTSQEEKIDYRRKNVASIQFDATNFYDPSVGNSATGTITVGTSNFSDTFTYAFNKGTFVSGIEYTTPSQEWPVGTSVEQFVASGAQLAESVTGSFSEFKMLNASSYPDQGTVTIGDVVLTYTSKATVGSVTTFTGQNVIGSTVLGTEVTQNGNTTVLVVGIAGPNNTVDVNIASTVAVTAVGGKYLLGVPSYDANRQYMVQQDSYTLTGIPSAHPMAILDDDITLSVTGPKNTEIYTNFDVSNTLMPGVTYSVTNNSGHDLHVNGVAIANNASGDVAVPESESIPYSYVTQATGSAPATITVTTTQDVTTTALGASTEMKIVSSNGNKYVLGSDSYDANLRYIAGSGTYTVTDVPDAHPLAIIGPTGISHSLSSAAPTITLTHDGSSVVASLPFMPGVSHNVTNSTGKEVTVAGTTIADTATDAVAVPEAETIDVSYDEVQAATAPVTVTITEDSPAVTLDGNSGVSVVSSNGNKYVLNDLTTYDSSRKYVATEGSYNLTGIPSGHPLAILGDANISIAPGVTALSLSVVDSNGTPVISNGDVMMPGITYTLTNNAGYTVTVNGNAVESGNDTTVDLKNDASLSDSTSIPYSYTSAASATAPTTEIPVTVYSYNGSHSYRFGGSTHNASWRFEKGASYNFSGSGLGDHPFKLWTEDSTGTKTYHIEGDSDIGDAVTTTEINVVSSNGNKYVLNGHTAQTYDPARKYILPNGSHQFTVLQVGHPLAIIGDANISIASNDTSLSLNIVDSNGTPAIEGTDVMMPGITYTLTNNAGYDVTVDGQNVASQASTTVDTTDRTSIPFSYTTTASATADSAVEVSVVTSTSQSYSYYGGYTTTTTHEYKFNGQANSAWTFEAGATYSFSSGSNMGSHPFRLWAETPTGNVTLINNLTSFDQSVTIPATATSVKYVCQVHSNMNGTWAIAGDATSTGSFDVLRKTVDGVARNFYYGDVTITVTGDYGTASMYCYYHGYMGGENILTHSPIKSGKSDFNVTFTIPNDAVSLKYECQNHSTMANEWTMATATTTNGSFDVLRKEVNGVLTNFYYGNATLTVTGNYSTSSLFCYYHGYMGGQDALIYSDTGLRTVRFNGATHSSVSTWVFGSETQYTFAATNLVNALAVWTEDAQGNKTYVVGDANGGATGAISVQATLNSTDHTTLKYEYESEANSWALTGINTVTDTLDVLRKSVNGTLTNFYYGDVAVSVTGDYGSASLYCYYHGYMGGQDVLLHDGDDIPTTTLYDGAVYDSSWTFQNGTVYTLTPSGTPLKYKDGNNVEQTVTLNGNNQFTPDATMVSIYVESGNEWNVLHPVTTNGTIDVLRKSVDGVFRNFYYGDVTMTVGAGFSTTASMYCYYHGYMGGQNAIVYGQLTSSVPSTITVLDGAAFAASGSLTIGNDTFTYTTKTGNVFSGITDEATETHEARLIDASVKTTATLTAAIRFEQYTNAASRQYDFGPDFLPESEYDEFSALTRAADGTSIQTSALGNDVIDVRQQRFDEVFDFRDANGNYVATVMQLIEAGFPFRSINESKVNGLGIRAPAAIQLFKLNGTQGALQDVEGYRTVTNYPLGRMRAIDTDGNPTIVQFYMPDPRFTIRERRNVLEGSDVYFTGTFEGLENLILRAHNKNGPFDTTVSIKQLKYIVEIRQDESLFPGDYTSYPVKVGTLSVKTSNNDIVTMTNETISKLTVSDTANYELDGRDLMFKGMIPLGQTTLETTVTYDAFPTVLNNLTVNNRYPITLNTIELPEGIHTVSQSSDDVYQQIIEENLSGNTRATYEVLGTDSDKFEFDNNNHLRFKGGEITITGTDKIQARTFDAYVQEENSAARSANISIFILRRRITPTSVDVEQLEGILEGSHTAANVFKLKVAAKDGVNEQWKYVAPPSSLSMAIDLNVIDAQSRFTLSESSITMNNDLVSHNEVFVRFTGRLVDLYSESVDSTTWKQRFPLVSIEATAAETSKVRTGLTIEFTDAAIDYTFPKIFLNADADGALYWPQGEALVETKTVTVTASLTENSNDITVDDASELFVGMVMPEHANIPAGTTILNISGTTVTLSATCSADATGVSLDMGSVVDDTKNHDPGAYIQFWGDGADPLISDVEDAQGNLATIRIDNGPQFHTFFHTGGIVGKGTVSSDASSLTFPYDGYAFAVGKEIYRVTTDGIGADTAPESIGTITAISLTSITTDGENKTVKKGDRIGLYRDVQVTTAVKKIVEGKTPMETVGVDQITMIKDQVGEYRIVYKCSILEDANGFPKTNVFAERTVFVRPKPRVPAGSALLQSDDIATGDYTVDAYNPSSVSVTVVGDVVNSATVTVNDAAGITVGQYLLNETSTAVVSSKSGNVLTLSESVSLADGDTVYFSVLDYTRPRQKPICASLYLEDTKDHTLQDDKDNWENLLQSTNFRVRVIGADADKFAVGKSGKNSKVAKVAFKGVHSATTTYDARVVASVGETWSTGGASFRLHIVGPEGQKALQIERVSADPDGVNGEFPAQHRLTWSDGDRPISGILAARNTSSGERSIHVRNADASAFAVGDVIHANGGAKLGVIRRKEIDGDVTEMTLEATLDINVTTQTELMRMRYTIDSVTSLEDIRCTVDYTDNKKRSESARATVCPFTVPAQITVADVNAASATIVTTEETVLRPHRFAFADPTGRASEPSIMVTADDSNILTLDGAQVLNGTLIPNDSLLNGLLVASGNEGVVKFRIYYDTATDAYDNVKKPKVSTPAITTMTLKATKYVDAQGALQSVPSSGATFQWSHRNSATVSGAVDNSTTVTVDDATAITTGQVLLTDTSITVDSKTSNTLTLSHALTLADGTAISFTTDMAGETAQNFVVPLRRSASRRRRRAGRPSPSRTRRRCRWV